MSRYTDAVCRLCRREGVKLFLKGERCETPKCAIDRRAYAPGQHGQARKKVSEYAGQLREKQKVRRLYGVSEKQYRRSFNTAAHTKGITGTLFLQALEARLDNMIYRSGLIPSRAQVRQLINHGHFLVNGKKVDIASFRVRVGSVITVREKSKALIVSLLGTRKPLVPEWLDVNFDTATITVVALPEREQLDSTIKEQLIIEYYSR